MIFARVAAEAIDPAEVLARVGSDRDGATVLFLGVVRDHADERPVSGMRYDAYQEMAGEVLRTIAEEAAERSGTDRVAVVHRFGELAIGEVSVAIAVSSPHRAEAYEASRYVIEQLKERLPVWKKEHYIDGVSEWVEGTVPPGTASGSEAAAVGKGGDA
ncbi:MAG: molybdenum cofactor biosynthesis protein MoaE [Gemmatimonadetes bacterium]|nr:molybdenum cofactor biosynthesis protein MoaE [Gemmatimonadota bacterium]